MTTYKESGVDITEADATKKVLKKLLSTSNRRVLNKVGAFASLFDFDFPTIKEPVLVLKSEEPGTKQLLAAQHDRLEDIAYDLVHHLINDIIAMGADPIAVLDTIIIGKIEKEKIVRLVDAMATACRDQGCTLVGGETSEQPGVVPEGEFILSASGVGVVEKSKIIDGSAIRAGDIVLGLSSSGPHTNGYSLIRNLLRDNPDLAERTMISSQGTFLDRVLTPHACYRRVVSDAIFFSPHVHGMAHITGGGIVDNLERIMPPGLAVEIPKDILKTYEVFGIIQKEGNVSDEEMFRVFNMGIGFILVVDRVNEDLIQGVIERSPHVMTTLGNVIKRPPPVSLI